MSIIAAGTTTTTALSSTGNTDGTLQLQVNGTTPSVTLNTLGAIGVGSSPSYGTSGQVLISGGATTAPTWGTAGTSTTATNLAGGSAGTVPYQSASGTTQMLAAGTSGQVLTSSGAGAPSWTTPSAGAVSFITSVTASNSATVDLENAMTGYDLYMITFNGVYSSAGTGFRLQLKINGSYQTTSNYEYSYMFAGSTGTEGAASDFIALGGSITTAASRPASGVLYVQNPSSTAAYKGVYGSTFTMPNSTEVFNYGVAGYFNNSTAALTGFRFYTNSGNIVAGTFRLYGISNS